VTYPFSGQGKQANYGNLIQFFFLLQKNNRGLAEIAAIVYAVSFIIKNTNNGRTQLSRNPRLHQLLMSNTACTRDRTHSHGIAIKHQLLQPAIAVASFGEATRLGSTTVGASVCLLEC